MKRGLALAFGALALLALAALVAGLEGTMFRGGKPLPSLPPLPEPSPQGPRVPVPEWLFQLLRAFFWGTLILFVLGLFVRDLRRLLLRLLLVVAVLILVFCGLQRLLRPEEREVPPPTAGPSSPQAPVGSSEAWERTRPPEWSVYVGALALGALLALWLTPKLFARWDRARQARALGEAAREARLELLQGAPVQDVVLRCWLRMVEILSRRSGTRDQPHFTPREFAHHLAKLGFRDEAISLLTQLFEEVRYGHKDSESRRELALSALTALEKVYG